MDNSPKKDIDAIIADGTEIDKAIRKAVLEHKLLGNPVADWRDGKVVWLQPDEINLPEEE